MRWRALNGEPIDVSADDSAEWRELLEVVAENQVDVSLSGVTREDQLQQDWFGGNRTKPVTITYPDGDMISGTFYLANYNEANRSQCMEAGNAPGYATSPLSIERHQGHRWPDFLDTLK